VGERGDSLGVATDTVNHLGGERVEEVQADEIEPGCIMDHAGLVVWHGVFIEDREVDPREASFIAGTPDDVLDLEGATILQDRLPVAHGRDARRALDTGRGKVSPFDTDQWSSTVQKLGPELAPNWGAYRENSVEQDAENQTHEKDAAEKPTDAKRYLARAASGHVHAPALGELHRELGAGVAGADEQHRPRLELARCLVVHGVQLHDRCGEVLGKRGNTRSLVVAHGDDDLLGAKHARPSLELVVTVVPRQSLDADPVQDGELEVSRVRLEVVGHLVFAWKRIGRRRKWEPIE